MTLEEIKALDEHIQKVYQIYMHDPIFKEFIGDSLVRPHEFCLWLLKIQVYETRLQSNKARSET